MENLSKQVRNATKWSLITEIIAKTISPITNMILARILLPEMFGVVATITMIISFVDMLADAGFQKYLVQHEFTNEKNKYERANVAFWTNLFISFLIWLLIIIFREEIANAMGISGLENVLVISGISIPITSLSSIQLSLYKRDFEFKTLFKVRLVGIVIPLFVTVPLAIFLRNYWALIIGIIVSNIVNSIILTVYSKWKPKLFYKIKILKEMISFSSWTLIEQFSIWLTAYSGTFVVAIYLDTFYLGIYKTSMTTVNQIITIITNATTPILFSSLSRLQHHNNEFITFYLRFQRIVGMFVIPLGVGIFIYKDFVTSILLGSQWKEAADFIGLWGLMSSITVVFSHYSSEVYRSKGKPKLSFVSQVLHIIVLIPVLLLFAKQGFELLFIARSLVRLEGIIVNFFLIKYYFNITPTSQLKNTLPYLFSSFIMFIVSCLLKNISDSIVWNLTSILICSIVYFSIVFLFKNNRKDIYFIIKLINKNNYKS